MLFNSISKSVDKNKTNLGFKFHFNQRFVGSNTSLKLNYYYYFFAIFQLHNYIPIGITQYVKWEPMDSIYGSLNKEMHLGEGRNDFLWELQLCFKWVM